MRISFMTLAILLASIWCAYAEAEEVVEQEQPGMFEICLAESIIAAAFLKALHSGVPKDKLTERTKQLIGAKSAEALSREALHYGGTPESFGQKFFDSCWYDLGGKTA